MNEETIEVVVPETMATRDVIGLITHVVSAGYRFVDLRGAIDEKVVIVFRRASK